MTIFHTETEPVTERVSFADLDVLREWSAFSPRTQYDFLEHLRSLVVEEDHDEIDEIRWCGYCGDPGPGEECDLRWLESEDMEVCDSCLSNHFEFCDGCDEYVRDTSYTLYGTYRCESCLDSGYRYCDYCDGYVYDDDYDHDHDDCGCEAPAQLFRIRNDGHGPLANDERTTVGLPAGTVSEQGMAQIQRLILRHPASQWEPEMDDERLALRQAWLDVAYTFAAEIGYSWQTKEGNFTKRLSRYAYKKHGLKVPADLLSEVGNIGHQHSQGKEFAVEVTRNLNLPAEEFAHEDSCWWQSYSESRCALKNNGGFGLRTFGEVQGWNGQTYENVTGRAWVMPLKTDAHGVLVPTFETESPDAFVVFNGYGDLGGYAPARIMAHLSGMTYRKIGFTCEPMYVNNDTGYLVAPEEIAARYTDGDLTLYVDSHANLHRAEEIERTQARLERERLTNAAICLV